MSRRLTTEEHKLWSRVARTVRAAPGKRIEPGEEGGEVSPAGKKLASSTQPKTPTRPAQGRPGPPEDLSGQRRIRRGQNDIDARLDLHGHTQDTAHRELIEFILREHARGSRCVLVITGKGRLGAGVLRNRFNDWIADPELRPLIAGFARAHVRHGGEGAVYLFLKAKRR